MIDVFDEGLLGGDEYLLAIGTFNDKQRVDGAFVHIDQCAEVPMCGILCVEADEVLPTILSILGLLSVGLLESIPLCS